LTVKTNRRPSSVSASALPRAPQIFQAIGAEAERRGHVFLPQTDDQLGFQISIGEDRFDFALREEQDKADAYSEEQIAVAKYSWQRVSPTPGTVPSGPADDRDGGRLQDTA
jgi:hypothetical protein